LEKNLSTFSPCPETLCKTKFKGDGLVYLWRKFQTSTALKLAAFNQIYSMNQEQKNKAQRFEKLAVWSEKLETRNT
jgi:hypothetical protein